MTTDVIKVFDDLGPALVGREAGARLRTEILRHADRNAVTVDLAGIESISPSFADELFGKLPTEIVATRRVKFANATDEIRALARGVRGLRREVARA